MPDIQDSTPVPDQPGNQKNVLQEPQIIPPSKSQSQKEGKPLPPIKYPPLLWGKTQELIKKIEQNINSKILVYFTDPMANITNDDVDYFFSHVRELQPESSVSLILISSGGSGMAAWRIANVLRKYSQSLTVIVPSRCASAATLLALSADKILFGPAGYLTAIDSSLNHPLNPTPTGSGEPPSISVDQVNRIEDFIIEDLKSHPSSKSLSEILFEKIHPVVLGELQRVSSLSKMIAKNMMKLRGSTPTEEEQTRISDRLNDFYPAHGYPIVLKEAQQIGLPAEATPQDFNPLLWELVKLYSLISKEVITNLTPGFYHMEGTPALIESIDRRTFFSLSYYKRFISPGLGWVKENNKSCWLSVTPNPESPEKPKISEIEL